MKQMFLVCVEKICPASLLKNVIDRGLGDPKGKPIEEA
jgi:hypothetical protein